MEFKSQKNEYKLSVNDKDVYVYINTNDLEVINRFLTAEQKISKILEISSLDEQIEEFKNTINILFGYNVYDVIFSEIQPFEVLETGQFYINAVFDYLFPLIFNDMQRDFEKIQQHSKSQKTKLNNKHTKKYVR
ncbi:MAG: hypothetical protein ATN36_06605 [Epulopiscium sp. Nele67-Bin005]|nr:MAG: hypothetical protein ATN36_06605 [Epulopiscium sp. Nele67-Bin005]